MIFLLIFKLPIFKNIRKTSVFPRFFDDFQSSMVLHRYVQTQQKTAVFECSSKNREN